MPQPQTKTPEQFQEDIESGIIVKTDQIDDFSDNTPEAALTYSLATQFDFVQQQNLDVAELSRGKLCAGADLDSYVGDFVESGFTPRLSASFATTTLTFANNQPNPNQGVIPFDTIVQNVVQPPAMPVQFQAIADPDNPASSTVLGGYIFPANGLTVAVTARCLTAGTIGNLEAGTLTVISSPNVPADNVTNQNAISNGNPTEEDGPLWQRFTDWMAALGGDGTERGICAAVSGTQVGLAFTYNDLTDQNGNEKDAYYTICVDDGSGSIPNVTIAAIKSSISAIRTGGIGFDVVPPQNEIVAVTVSGTVAQPGFQLGQVQLALQQAIIAWVNANGPGGSTYGSGGLNPTGKLPFIGLIQLVESFVGTQPGQGLLGYANLQINNAYQDIPLTNFQLARTDLTHVTIS